MLFEWPSVVSRRSCPDIAVQKQLSRHSCQDLATLTDCIVTFYETIKQFLGQKVSSNEISISLKKTAAANSCVNLCIFSFPHWRDITIYFIHWLCFEFHNVSLKYKHINLNCTQLYIVIFNVVELKLMFISEGSMSEYGISNERCISLSLMM